MFDLGTEKRSRSVQCFVRSENTDAVRSPYLIKHFSTQRKAVYPTSPTLILEKDKILRLVKHIVSQEITHQHVLNVPALVSTLLQHVSD
jgi:hypothetical protein